MHKRTLDSQSTSCIFYIRIYKYIWFLFLLFSLKFRSCVIIYLYGIFVISFQSFPSFVRI